MRLWSRWVAALEVQESGTSLAVFRVLIGLSVWATVGWVVVGGIVEPVWVDRSFGGMHDLRDNWLRLFGGQTPTVAWSVVAGALATSALLVVGLGGRLTALVTLVLVQTLVGSNPYTGAAYDTLLLNGLWLCVLGPASRTLSLDARLRSGRWAPEVTIGAWARYLVVVQLIVMYTSTGVQKVSAYWVPGGDFSALYYILQMANFHYSDMSWVADYFLLTQIGTAVTWFWECSAPVLLLAVWASDGKRGGSVGRWMRRLRVREIYVVMGLIMHVSLFFLMELGPFGITSLAFYAALVHPSEWEALFDRFTGPRPLPALGDGDPSASET